MQRHAVASLRRSDRACRQTGSVLFTPLLEVLFTFPSTVLVRYRSLGSIWPCRMGPTLIRKISRARATQDAAGLQSSVVYGVFTLYDPPFRAFRPALSCRVVVHNPQCRLDDMGLGSSVFARHLPESLFIFSSWVLRCFSSPRSPPLLGWQAFNPARLPHSDIPGSKGCCASPGLFAAYHVLRRLREPRHPPSALAYFLSPRA